MIWLRKLGLVYAMIWLGFIYGCLLTNAVWLAPHLVQSLLARLG